MYCDGSSCPYSVKSFGETFQEIFHKKLATNLLQYNRMHRKIISIKFQEV